MMKVPLPCSDGYLYEALSVFQCEIMMTRFGIQGLLSAPYHYDCCIALALFGNYPLNAFLAHITTTFKITNNRNI